MHKPRNGGLFLERGLKGVVIFIVLALMLSACGGEREGDLAVGDKAPDFSLQSSSGETVQLSDYEGEQPVLLYFHMAVG